MLDAGVGLVVGRIAELEHPRERVEHPTAELGVVALRGVGGEHPRLELRVGHDRDPLGERQRRDLAVHGVGQQRVQRALQPEQEADRHAARPGPSSPRRRRSRPASSSSWRRQRVAARLHERERQRPARLLGHAPEDRELGVDVGEVGDDLQHALARCVPIARAMPTSSSASR